MSREKKEAVIEAILFSMGDSVSLDKLADAIDESEETTRKIIEEYKNKAQTAKNTPLLPFNLPGCEPNFLYIS